MSKSPDSVWQQRMKYVGSDLLTSFIAFFLFNIFRYFVLGERIAGHSSLEGYLLSVKLVGEQILVPVAMCGVYWLSGYYNQPFGKSRLEEIVTTLFSALVNTAWIYLALLINDLTWMRRINYELLLALFMLLSLSTYSGRIIITLRARMHFRKKQWKFRTLVIGDSASARRTARSLVNDSVREGYEIMGFYPLEGEKSTGDAMTLDSAVDPSEFCNLNNIDRVIIAQEKRDDSKVLDILYRLFPLDIPIKIAPDTMSFLTSSIRLKDIFGEPFEDLTSAGLSEGSKNIKRLCDVVVSAAALVILSPLMLWAAIGVKRSSKGPVFYSQERIGLRKRPFRIYKFRSMYVDSEKGGPRLTVTDDSRVTPFGALLRKYRIDELPQFWNVIKGDMSIVGPRPEREFFIKKIMEKAPYYTLMYQVRPGITSWGMVKYGYASSVEEMVERMRYDLIYMANMSISIDIKILIYTLRTLARGEGK